MLKYAICEIGGKQYRVEPGKPFDVTLPGQAREVKKVEANVLFLVEDGKIKIGKPYLKDKITLKCFEVLKGQKIRVAKFHAKANYRRVKGFRAKFTKVVLET